MDSLRDNRQGLRGLRSAAVLAAAVLAGCDSDAPPAPAVPGGLDLSTLPKPRETSDAPETWFFVDPNQGGLGSGPRLVRLYAGRLVDVYDVPEEAAAAGGRRLLFEDLVVGEDVVTDGQRYVLDTNPATQETSLTILAENDLDDPDDAFDALLREAELRVRPVGQKGPGDLAPFPLVPRNGALVMQFDDLLDHETVSRRTIQVRVGTPSEEPFEARIFPDPSHGALLTGADGRPRFHATRVVVDFTVSQLEAETAPEPLTPNALGLPASATLDKPNVLLRIPTRIDFAEAVFERLENVAGRGLASDAANAPLDGSSGSLPVVRALRAGGPADTGAGFLRDQRAPRIVGEQGISVELSAPDPAPGARPGFDFLVDLRFEAVPCAAPPEEGDVLDLPGGFFEVTAAGGAPIGGRLEGVAVTSLQTTGNEAQDLVGPGTYLAPFDRLEDRPECFVRFVPGLTSDPGAVEPMSELRVRFSEPMDPRTITAFDSFMIVTEPLAPRPTEVVAARVSASADLQVFTLTPSLPLPHVEGFSEEYTFVMDLGAEPPADLGGNPLEALLPDVTFGLRPEAPGNASGSYVLRFGARDEDGNSVVDPETGDVLLVRPEIRGQFLYDLDRGVLRARPVSRFLAVADRNHPVTFLMAAFPLGVQTPLSPLGSRLMHVWRYCDFGFDLLDETLFNIDVEGLSWSPLNGAVSADRYEEFRIRLAHSNRLPDEAQIDNGFAPDFPESGLKRGVFESTGAEGNLLEDPLNVLTEVYPRERGYVVDPTDLYVSPEGTPLMPWPLNRDPDLASHLLYTWRDTAIIARGGPFGAGADLKSLVAPGIIPEEGIGVPYRAGEVPSIGLPLLMEYSCYPSNTGVGLNSFDVSLAINSSGQPNFRLFSTGGIDSTDTPVSKDPDQEVKATGGFNPNNGGNKTKGFDVVFYHGAVDVVVRVSRLVTIWIGAGDPLRRKDWSDPSVEPRASDQPTGTSVVLAFRGAREVGFDPGTSGEGNRWDANTYDIYGDPVAGTGWGSPLNPVLHWPDPTDRSWSDSIDAVDGSTYLQIRVSLIGNTVSSLTPELSAIGVPFSYLAPGE